jgi:D-alanine--poly(phosphoribitol) ligase subunit 1
MIIQIKASIENYPDNNAFYIQKEYTTYSELGTKISIIKKEIEKNSPPSQKLIGFLTYDDIETYSSALATLFAGKGLMKKMTSCISAGSIIK